MTKRLLKLTNTKRTIGKTNEHTSLFVLTRVLLTTIAAAHMQIKMHLPIKQSLRV